MTVAALPATVTYVEDGSTTVFPVPFRFKAAGDLIVERLVPPLVLTLQLGVDYTVTGGATDAGGALTRTGAGSGGRLRIRRATARQQPMVYTAGDRFPAASHEQALDRAMLIDQEQDAGIADLVARALLVPPGEATAALPPAALRAGRVLAFDALGNPGAGFTTAQLALAISNATASLAGGTTAQTISFLRASLGAIVRSVQGRLEEWLSAADFGVVGDGVADDTLAMQRAIDATIAEGKALFIPVGLYRITSTLVMRPSVPFSFTTAFCPAPVIDGAGIGKTRFLWRGSGAMLDLECDVDHTTTRRFAMGGRFSGFTIYADGSSSATGDAIRLRAVYGFDLRDIVIWGMKRSGIVDGTLLGDGDANNMILYQNLRVYYCKAWGFDAPAAPGANETSFIGFDRVFLQGCGTDSAAYPPTSGGMRWKGQIADIRNSAFEINVNVDLYVPGSSGLANSLTLTNTTFEGCPRYKVLLAGIDNFHARQCQLYSSDDGLGLGHRTETAVQIDHTILPSRNVTFENTIVRAPAFNYDQVTFKVTGASSIQRGYVKVYGTAWQDYGHGAGQKRFVNVDFDPVPMQAECSIIATTAILAPTDRGAAFPFKLRYNAEGDTASEDGELVPYSVPAGGLTADLTGLANGTWYAYLYDNGNQPTIGLSSVAPVADDTTTRVSVRGDMKGWVYLCRVVKAGGSVDTGNWVNARYDRRLGGYLWANTANKLYLKASATAPTSDTDGVVVGAQS